MGIGFVGGRMRKTRDSREWKCEWALQGEGPAGNGNELCSEDGMRMTEHRMVVLEIIYAIL